MVLCVFFMTGAPESFTESISEEARDRTCHPWFTRQRTYQLHHSGRLIWVKKLTLSVGSMF